MKVYKVFKVEEIENALKQAGLCGEDFFEYLDGEFCNGVAIPWHIENQDDIKLFHAEKHHSLLNTINKFLIEQGCDSDERVYIEIFW